VVLVKVLGRGQPKSAFRPYSVDDRLPDFLRSLCEVLFRLCEIAYGVKTRLDERNPLIYRDFPSPL